MSDPDRYTLISADSHAGAAQGVYREFLEPDYRAEFDVWRRQDWTEDEARLAQESLQSRDVARNEQQDADGVVGEVVFPDGRPPFYPNRAFLSGPPRPEDYDRRRAGVRALNRWMATYCAEFPNRRAGVGTILLNDVDDAVADVNWIAQNGLRGGIQVPNITPDVDWVPSLVDDRYDRLWATCQDLDVTINMHGESSFPQVGRREHDVVAFLAEAPYYSLRPLVLMVVAGVFDRFPRLKLVLSEQTLGHLVAAVEYLDPIYAVIRKTGAYGDFRLDESETLSRPPSDYLRTNVWFTASPPLPGDLDAVRATVGLDHLMIGNDYPHREGTYPHTAAILRQVFHDWQPAAIRKLTAETPAALYGFDLDVLERDASRVGPLVDEVAQPLTELPTDPNHALLVNALSLG